MKVKGIMNRTETREHSFEVEVPDNSSKDQIEQALHEAAGDFDWNDVAGCKLVDYEIESIETLEEN